jgi:hypothetical protein
MTAAGASQGAPATEERTGARKSAGGMGVMTAAGASQGAPATEERTGARKSAGGME